MCGLRNNPGGKKLVKRCGKLPDVQGKTTTKDKKRKFLRIIESDTQN